MCDGPDVSLSGGEVKAPEASRRGIKLAAQQEAGYLPLVAAAKCKQACAWSIACRNKECGVETA